jgi:hypothetical protein
MKRVEDELTEMFDRRAPDMPTSHADLDQVVQRTRRHQVRTVFVGVSCVVVLALVSMGVVMLGAGERGAVRPAEDVILATPPEGFSSAALAFASIAYPNDWVLLDTSSVRQQDEALPGSLLQLSNIDPDVPRSPRCTNGPDSLEAGAVLLSVSVVGTAPPSAEATGDASPPALSPTGAEAERVCPQIREQASWTGTNGLEYRASVAWADDAAQDDIDALHRAYETLRFPPTGEPWLDGPDVGESSATPLVVLGSATYGSHVLTFGAYVNEFDGRDTLWVGSISDGPWSSMTGPHTGSDPNEPVAAGLSIIGEGAALLDGTIGPEVDRVEVRTDSGDVVPMNIAPLPASLGTDDRFVWALVPGAGEDAVVVGYDANGEPFGDPIFPIAPPTVIAEGVETGESWTLKVKHDTEGWTLWFDFADGGGGGGGVDLGDQVFGSSLSGGLSWNIDTGWSKTPSELVGVVTDRAAAVEYQLVDGTTIPATLYPVPDEAFGGGAQAYVLFVPYEVLIKAGDLVAYDGDGTELGRHYVDSSPVALYPKVVEQASPDALQAMRSMQLAGAVAQRYMLEHDTWDGFDPTSAGEIAPSLTYNTSDEAIPGEISIRVVRDRALVLATSTPGGDVYSACFQDALSFTMAGRNDTTDPSECSNGWLNEP